MSGIPPEATILLLGHRVSNRRHRCVGHLFRGHFKGHLTEEEEYILEVSRYIHPNPVRAGLVDRPEA